MASVQDFRNRLPAFDPVSDETIQTWLDEAALTVDADWGEHQDRAQIYLAAHLMSMTGIGPEKGAAALAGASSLGTGSLSISRADDKAKDHYNWSSFGRLYWEILRGVKSGPRVTGGGCVPWPWTGGDDPWSPYNAT